MFEYKSSFSEHIRNNQKIGKFIVAQLSRLLRLGLIKGKIYFEVKFIKQMQLNEVCITFIFFLCTYFAFNTNNLKFKY